MGARRYLVRRDDFRGAYDSTVSYPTGSIVRYQGSAWRALRPVQGVAPVEGPDWTLMVGKGDIGPRGYSVLYGARDPSSSDGQDGEFWINTDTDAIFGPKAAGAWPAGTSLVGPKGDTGPPPWNDRGDYVSGDVYEADDAVRHAGSFWLALRQNQNVEPAEGPDWTAIVSKGDTGDPGIINRVRVGDVDQAQRANLNFAAPYFVGTDDATNNETELTVADAVAGGASGLQSGADKAKLGALGHGYANVYKDTDTPLDYNTPKAVPYEVEEADANGYFSGSRYTSQVAGRYEVWGYLYIRGVAAGDRVQMRFYKNGIQYVAPMAIHAANTADIAISASAPIPMNGTTDYLEVWAAVFGSGGTPVVLGLELNRMIVQHTGAGV